MVGLWIGFVGVELSWSFFYFRFWFVFFFLRLEVLFLFWVLGRIFFYSFYSG